MASDIDLKIQETQNSIQREQKILEATRNFKQATSNPDVLRRLEAKIKESDQSLAYLHSVLRDLQALKAGGGQGQDPRMLGASSPQVGLPSSPRDTLPSNRDHFPPQTPQFDARRDASSPEAISPGRNSQSGPVPPPKPKPHNLDLIKADTPITSAKISRMLHQLSFKLQVEMQYRQGIEKMAKLYQADGDKKSRADAEAKKIESQQKIQLLQTALKRYKGLHIIEEAVDEEEENHAPHDASERRAKALSGTLYVTVNQARDLDHAPVASSGWSRSSSKQFCETHVSIKVEGNQMARSHPSRTDRWNEDFEIPVDKANEVEIVLYDKQSTEPHPVPIGLFWIRISDLVDAIRRQKVMMENNPNEWMTAGAMGDSPTTAMYPAHTGDLNAPIGFRAPGAGLGQGSVPGVGATQSEGIDAWFAVEPVGALSLQLNFVKENVRKRPFDAPLGGLGRQGALRKRKGDVHEMNGHKFVQRQFYQIMLCAFCSEFLLNAFGYQCEDCRYTCHKKCYEKVVTKCISKSTTGDGDEEKINHRIPHRFDSFTNLGTNWCCHCGYMLPFGRKNSRKCTECGITCHANCAHLVPDFCGMSMETANELLRNWRDINKAKASRPQRPQPLIEQATTLPPLDGQMDKLTLTGVPEPPAAPDYRPPPVQQQPPAGPPPGYPQDPRYYQQGSQQQIPPAPYGTPSSQQHPPRPPAGARIPIPPGYSEPLAPQRPQSRYDQPPIGMQPQDYEQVGYTVPRPQSGGPGRTPGQQPLGPNVGRPPSAPPQQIPPGPPPPLQQPQYPHQQHQQQHPQYPQQQQQQQPPQFQQPPPQPPQQLQQRPPQPPQRQGTVKRKVGLDDFNFLAVLGKGNFGKVMLAEEKKTNGLYAIKVLKKEFIIDNDEVESTRSEKRVFLAAARERHPFLLGLHSCFQTETRIYFVMEYVSGGDLMLHIQRKQFSIRQAKFYAAEVLLALEYFHANGIIYRDLKLDNILLTLDGHVKVADYGLCKEEMWFGSTTSTFCGTPEFMAPEILLEQRYGRAVDWWAFGVLMYEMLLGQSPFRGDDEDEIFDAILEDEPLYPITMPRDAVSILQKLLTRDPARRLGSAKEDAAEIKRQPFFKDTNWDNVLNKRDPPPYFPTINGVADTSNFDEEFTREQPTLTPVHGQLSARDQAEFNGFSWVASWADI